MSMWDSFTASARRSVQLANGEAQRAGEASWQVPEYLLLGILAAAEGAPAEALRELGLELEPLRRQVDLVRGAAKHSTREDTKRFKRVIERAFREGRRHASPRIDTTHLLLGIAAERRGGVAKVLELSGTSRNALEFRVNAIAR